MVGGDKDILETKLRPLAQSFAKKIVHCGPVGAGHAVKAINNSLNMLNLLSATEGLLALTNFGVDADVAADIINTSSGRSLQVCKHSHFPFSSPL